MSEKLKIAPVELLPYCRDYALETVIAIIKYHNITADELPCLWLSPDKAVEKTTQPLDGAFLMG